MKADVEELVVKVLTRPTVDNLLTVTSGLSTTNYTLNNSLTDYDLVTIVAYTGYSNRWEMTLPVIEFTSTTTQNYYTSLGTEYSVYNLAVKYRNATSITIVGKGTGVNGIGVYGIKL